MLNLLLLWDWYKIFVEYYFDTGKEDRKWTY